MVSCGQFENFVNSKIEDEYYKQTLPDIEYPGFSYSFRDFGCTTGQHEFSTKREACENLLNNEVNRDCAREKRKDLYTLECGTDFDQRVF
jgi:hypothetical protein